MLSRRSVNDNYEKAVFAALDADLVPFLAEHQALVFYAIAFVIDPQNGALSVSLNTDFDFHRRRKLDETLQGSDTKHGSRFCIRDWHYQSILQVSPVSQEAYDLYYAPKLEMFVKMVILMIERYLEQSLPDFQGDFIVFVDQEPLAHTLKRMARVCQRQPKDSLII